MTRERLKTESCSASHQRPLDQGASEGWDLKNMGRPWQLLLSLSYTISQFWNHLPPDLFSLLFNCRRKVLSFSEFASCYLACMH
jgi:hypothetical protein